MPGAPVPSTANGSMKLDLHMAFTSKAEQQAEQQGAQCQRHAQRLEAMQFGIGIALGGFGSGHRSSPCKVHGYIKPPPRALAPAESGRAAAGMWRNAGRRTAWLAYARPA
ncbi:hypothetical protein GCM10009121_05620 [Rhodanobacter soli]